MKLANSSNRQHETNPSFLSNGRRIVMQKNSQTMPLSGVGPSSDLSALLSPEHVSKQLSPNNLMEKNPKDIRKMIAT